MPVCGPPDALAAQDRERANIIVMQAYVQLPLLPRRPDGSWVALLRRFEDFELRLVESVSAAPGESVLRVDIFDRRTQSVVESRNCEEVEDAVVAFRTMASPFVR
jgi:hypothetical protein